MADKDVVNKVPIYKLKTTDEVMKYYDEWGTNNKYDQDMIDWNYTGPKETVETFMKYAKNKEIKIYDAGCGTGLVGTELKKYGYTNFDGADLSQKLLDLVRHRSNGEPCLDDCPTRNNEGYAVLDYHYFMGDKEPYMSTEMIKNK